MIIDAEPTRAKRGHRLMCKIGWHAWERQRWHEPPASNEMAVYFASSHEYDVCACCHKTKAVKE